MAGREAGWHGSRLPPGRHPSRHQRGDRPCYGPCSHRQAIHAQFRRRPEGTLLDGTPLKSAIAAIDAAVTPRPLAYLINCTHVSFAASALMHETNSSTLVRHRTIGLLANTAAAEPRGAERQQQPGGGGSRNLRPIRCSTAPGTGPEDPGGMLRYRRPSSGPWQRSLQFRHDKRISATQKTL